MARDIQNCPAWAYWDPNCGVPGPAPQPPLCPVPALPPANEGAPNLQETSSEESFLTSDDSPGPTPPGNAAPAQSALVAAWSGPAPARHPLTFPPAMMIMAPVVLDWPFVVLSQIKAWSYGANFLPEKHMWIWGFSHYERARFIKTALDAVGVPPDQICEIWARMESSFLATFRPEQHSVLMLNLHGALTAQNSAALWGLLTGHPFWIERPAEIIHYKVPWRGLCFVLSPRAPENTLLPPYHLSGVGSIICQGVEVPLPRSQKKK